MSPIKFFKQTQKDSCNITAIQQALSFFDLYPTFEEIREALPRHKFGSWLPEIGAYLEDGGIRTKLISNSSEFKSKNRLFVRALREYQNKGDFIDRVPAKEDVEKRPIIINVDALKIRKEQGRPSAHYVVLLEEKGCCYFYDGNNFDKKMKTTFEEIYQASLDINRLHEDGMWLVCEGEK